MAQKWRDQMRNVKNNRKGFYRYIRQQKEDNRNCTIIEKQDRRPGYDCL